MLIRPEFFRKNVVVCQRNERKTENGRRRQNFGEILVKTLKNRNTGLFEPIGGCGPTNMTNGGGMNMVVSKNYKIKEQNGMYYIVPSSVPGCPQCGGYICFAAIQVYGVWACSSGTPGHHGSS